MIYNGLDMKVSADRKRGLKKVGQHEVSHFIVAKVLGFETGPISLEVTHPHDGHNAGAEINLYNKLSGLDNIIDYLERRITVLFAGVIGESLSLGKIDNDYALKELNNGGKSDYDKSL